MHGLERYQKRINLANFIRNIQSIRYEANVVKQDVERIKSEMISVKQKEPDTIKLAAELASFNASE